MAFAQNTRDEVRLINGDGQIVGALSADAGMKQTNYLCQPAVAFKPCIGRNGRGYEVERSPALSMGGGVTSDTRPCVVQPVTGTLASGDGAKWGSNQWVDEGKAVIGFSADMRSDEAASPREGSTSALTVGQRAAVAGIDPYNASEADTASSLGANLSVRRLTPRECERLQGLPDDYTAVPYRNKPAADGPRYRALGNSMAVNVMSWIGQRIEGANQ